ncbi:MAG: TetR/AcrR family transcriptional regulator [Pseudomonadota bacterium]|nr:TetR/AcrR family transcriptional regulator [Pseudomonadota bacterium]
MADSDASVDTDCRKKISENLTREDWISGAWNMLGEGGLDGVRIEPLARRLGVTKGSFYWHFKDRQELLDALLDLWFSSWDYEISHDLLTDAAPSDRIWALFESVIGRLSRGQTVSLRMLSHNDQDVARRIEERDRQRLAFLIDQLQEIGFSPDEASVRGQVYQVIMTGEFLRSGGQPLSERIDRARDYHLLLSTRPQ